MIRVSVIKRFKTLKTGYVFRERLRYPYCTQPPTQFDKQLEFEFKTELHDKRGQKHLINNIEDIYGFKKELTDIVDKYQTS